ncbi:hypothetical protein MMU07_11090 [Aquiflexum sp. LQ15W]|uniref:hypothetical protein n=1 Tax=Cognataquiflexum nitidum TaxID=2922272 RepID=UPI001F139BD6|nr:hypothetical protein [Cognataquiflexum nitidum]MCH6200130.1 hypothetical protein [Cognataquiflexum nitidum]
MMTSLISPKNESRNSVLFLVLILFFSSFSQIKAQKSLSLEEFINQEGENNTVFIKNLVFENIPTVLLKDSKIQTLGEGFPQKVSSDISSLELLKSENNIFRTVKILQINLGSEAEKSALKINLSELKGFSNLVYIFINSETSLSPDEVDRMVSGYEDGDVIVLFQVNTNF